MITIQEDHYVKDYAEHNVRWVVTLNNGDIAYDDDGRPDASDPAWMRLKAYCEENGLYITNMRIEFRSHIKELPANRNGYYFKRSSLGQFGSNVTKQFVIVGYEEDGAVTTTKWLCPELLDHGPKPKEITDPCYIGKPNAKVSSGEETT